MIQETVLPSAISYEHPPKIRSDHREHQKGPLKALAADGHDEEQYQQEKPWAMQELIDFPAGGGDIRKLRLQFFLQLQLRQQLHVLSLLIS